MKEHFEKFLGSGNASDNANDLAAYSYDGSELSGKARIVLYPSQDEQMRLILSYCNRSNIDVVIRGNGTNIMGMTIPNQSIVLSTQGFDRVHALNVREQWVNVDCGVTITELNEALKEHGYRYPLEPSGKKLTTIGSILARNGSSRHSQKYGKAIDTVVGLELIDGTGKYFTVNKDFEEYLGNEGSALMILRAKVKIVPIQDRSVDIHYFDTLTQALEKINEVKQLGPLSIELLDSAAATYAGYNTKHTLLVEWEGTRGAVQYENYASLMNKRENLRKTLGGAGYILLDDGYAPEEVLLEVLEWCRNHELPFVCHAGMGIIHPFFKREQEALRDTWCEYLIAHNGQAAGQFGYGLRKKKYVPAGLKTKVRKLKERYDYNNILGRGKLYDYI